MPAYSQTLLERLAVMQAEVVPNSDAPYGAFSTQEAYPYWTNRVESVDVESEADDLQTRTYRVRMRLVLANLTEDYDDGAVEKRAATTLDDVLDFFAQRKRLICTAAPTKILYLQPGGADIVSANLNYGILNTGAGNAQLVIDFVIECPLTVPTSTIYA